MFNDDDDDDYGYGAPRRRFKKKAPKPQSQPQAPQEKIIKEVIIPEIITVQDLANRMAEKSSDVIKKLMSLGVMATLIRRLMPIRRRLSLKKWGINLNAWPKAMLRKA